MFDAALRMLSLSLLRSDSMPHFVYILKCADGSYYVGSTHNLEKRFAEHQSGELKGYTSSRLPVELVWSNEFPKKNEAFLAERQIKGWSRAKKEALIRENWGLIHKIVKEERFTRRAKKAKEKKGQTS
jgi:predicted GIY-YIG superfamily endonuclease